MLPCHFGTRLGRLGGVGCFFEGKVLSNRDPGGEREQDGHVTRRPRHKENGETHTETEVLIYMNVSEGTLAGSVPDGVYATQDTCYLMVTLSQSISVYACLGRGLVHDPCNVLHIKSRALKCTLSSHLHKFPHILSHVKTTSLVQFIHQCQIESTI